MTDSEKSTVKIPAYPGREIPQSNLTEEQDKALEQAKRNALLQEEKNKTLELQKTIEQLRESLKQERAKADEIAERAVTLEARVEELTGLESNIQKVADLEARVKELTETLKKISGIASEGKSD